MPVNDFMQVSIESLKEILERTLSSRDIGLLLLYLKENGAIRHEQVDVQQFQIAMRELFGEGSLIFFELLGCLSRQNATGSPK